MKSLLSFLIEGEIWLSRVSGGDVCGYMIWSLNETSLYNYNVMEAPSVSHKPIRITKLPIKIIEDPRLLNGLIRFSTESFKTELGAMQGTAAMKRNIISMFRPNAVQQEEEEGEE